MNTNDTILENVQEGKSKCSSEIKLADNNFTNEIKYDIGNYIDQELDDEIKRNIILNPWVPPKNYIFPYKEHIQKGRLVKRFAKRTDLENFEWVVFSHVHEGFYCKYCPFFVTRRLGGYNKHVELNYLVKTALTTFKKLYGWDGYLTKHCYVSSELVLVDVS